MKFTSEQCMDIYVAREKGWKAQTLAELYGTSKSSIYYAAKVGQKVIKKNKVLANAARLLRGEKPLYDI